MMRFSAFPCLTLALTTVLTGCAFYPVAPASESDGLEISGRVHGGQQAVSGAHVYLMQATTAGYGNAATDILTSGDGTDTIGKYVLSGPDGSFALGGKYTCTQNNQVYVLAEQGNPGLTAGTNNTALALMAMLGNCPAGGSFATAYPNLVVNEVTTVAGAFAMGGFMSGPTQMSSSSTNASVGLANAALISNAMTDIVHGSAFTTTPNGYGTVTTNKINTIANILAACVNTDGTNTTGTNCYKLFTNAVNGATQPTDTITAMLNIVHFPSQNYSSLIDLSSPTAPFQPTITSNSATDLAINITYNNVDADTTTAPLFDIDNQGNFYKSDYGTYTRKVSPLGAVLASYTSAGVENATFASFVDPNTENVWVTNGNTQKVAVYNTTSNAAVTGSGFTYSSAAPASYYPTAFAFDNSSNVYGILYGCNLIKGLNASPFTYTVYTLTGACTTNGNYGSVQITSGGLVWIAQGGTTDTVQTTTTAAPATSASITNNSVGASGYKIASMAIDSNQNAWLLQSNPNTLNSLMSGWDNTQAVLSNSPWAITHSIFNNLAIDGANTLWAATGTGPASYLTSAPGTAVTTVSNNAQPHGTCKPDQAGNMWCSIQKGFVVYPGIATPTANPVAMSNHGAKP